MSTIATSLCLWASTVLVIKIDGNAAVGLAVSSFFIHSLCLLPSAQCLALTLPSLFSTRKINEFNTFDRSSGVNVSTEIGLKHALLCNWFISS